MLTVIIIAKNEQRNIRRCLESVAWADELIVLDSGSTDDTIAIAREFTNNVFSTDWLGYGIQKQRALERATGNWLLNLDADESVDGRLKNQIINVMAEDSVDACRIPIQMYFCGEPLRFSSSPKRHIRLFKREGACYSTDIVHEKIILPTSARIGQLSVPIMHHSFQDVSHALYKINRYSSYSAKIRIKANKDASLCKSLASSSWMFFRCYFLQRGFMDGRVGFLFALFNAQGSLYRGIKQIYPDLDINQLP